MPLLSNRHDPVATEAAAHLRTSEARSSSSGVRSDAKFTTVTDDVKTISRALEKKFQDYFRGHTP
jgi:hypothetical protein